MTLTPSSPLVQIDRKIANRRVGLRKKGDPAHEVLARSLGVAEVGALLHHYPRRYIDRSQVAEIRKIRVGQQATVIARVKRVNKRVTRRRQSMVMVTLYDGTGYLELNFFNQPWAANMYRAGQELAVSGTVANYRGKLQMTNFEVEVLQSADADTVHTGRITPVHPATEGVTTRTIRELVYGALEQIPALADPLPADVLRGEELESFDRAVRTIHFPESSEDLNRAQERLKFDELFILELGVAFRKHRVESDAVGVAHDPGTPLLKRFLEALPFEPTAAQLRAFEEVKQAMGRPHPMNLLLQGDVGSGKTVVALAAALVAVGSGHQAAIMAPTEVLAGQHARSVEALLAPIGAAPAVVSGDGRAPGQASLLDSDAPPTLRFATLSAAVTGKERTAVLEAIADGRVDLVVGTHALVQEAVEFHDLSLAVVDEQHRFGVHQRMQLKGKGADPDVLVMTATPIPRTLALTYYGDLDVSVLDEMPRGRQPIETTIVRTDAEREAAYQLVRTEIASGRQAFVVCAAIDEANKAEVRAAEKEAVRLANDVFPELKVELLHGRMRPAEKDRKMEEFRAGEHDLLISTTVIEVGVDVPNASVMMVENAERFGLAQLHQLRGRIGRGAHRSYCFLFDHAGPDNEIAADRLAAMARTTDGFDLADDDLRLRGEGTLFDVRQSGLPDLKLARLAEDLDLVKRARARAFALIEADPDLSEHPGLRKELESRFADSIDWLFYS
ncbi:MAG: ATP-dependent DNA helicase RecG [Actinomycetota bacterium]